MPKIRIKRQSASNPKYKTSARGRMSAGTVGKSGQYIAGGYAQTLGGGRGGKLASRRQRYYDVRVGLGLAGG